MHERILMSGSGGQGIMLIGKILATAAIHHVPHLTFFPCYGAEVRGGSSYCQIILSSDEISSPLADRFDSMILMNQESADRFLSRLEPTGAAVVNCTLTNTSPDPRIIAVPATADAQALGTPRIANFIALGALLGIRGLVPAATVESVTREAFAGRDPSIVALNLKALQAGLETGPAKPA